MNARAQNIQLSQPGGELREQQVAADRSDNNLSALIDIEAFITLFALIIDELKSCKQLSSPLIPQISCTNN